MLEIARRMKQLEPVVRRVLETLRRRIGRGRRGDAGTASGLAAAFLLLLIAAGCQPAARGTAQPAPTPSVSAVRFTDVTDQVGIHFKHTNGRSGKLLLPETLGAGCAFLDYNNDGWPDLFLVNSSRLPGFKGKGPFFSALYRNDGGSHFTDVTREAGLALDCYGMGVAVADYDGDGYQDLLLTALGSCHLFHNQGDGTFREETGAAGLGRAGFWTSAAWLDYDRDGKLDLYVCNYARWSLATNQLCPDSFRRPHMCGPSYYQGVPSALYHNNGDGTFTDVTRKAHLYETVGKALGVLVWDYDGDGWPDLLVARDMEPNLLYRNNRDGTFTERGVEAGVAYSNQGAVRAGMGVDTADTTNGGRESVFIGNNTSQGLAQYLPDAQGRFTDVADRTGIYEASLQILTFGLVMLDYDGDGRKDLFTANGHVDENVHLTGGGATYPEKLLVFRNGGDGKFTPVGEQLGPIFREKRVWRGLALGDFDGDGDPDLLASVCNGKPALLRNDGGNRNPWLQVKAIAAGRNREGIGARVTVSAGGTRQTGWIRSGSSYCSAGELTAFFGLGGAGRAERVEVQFPDGQREAVEGVSADQLVVVQEGKGVVAQGAPQPTAAKLLPPLRHRAAARASGGSANIMGQRGLTGVKVGTRSVSGGEAAAARPEHAEGSPRSRSEALQRTPLRGLGEPKMAWTTQALEQALAYLVGRVRDLESVVTPGGNQFEHALRTAESLRRRGGDALLVATGLVHDIGKAEDPARHPEIGAAWLEGHVHPEVVWLVRWHVVAQRMERVPEPLASELRSHPRYADLQLLIHVDYHPEPVEPLPALTSFEEELRAAIVGRQPPTADDKIDVRGV
jgi:hypothetical protein